jgi:hypothetical protein
MRSHHALRVGVANRVIPVHSPGAPHGPDHPAYHLRGVGSHHCLDSGLGVRRTTIHCACRSQSTPCPRRDRPGRFLPFDLLKATLNERSPHPVQRGGASRCGKACRNFPTRFPTELFTTGWEETELFYRSPSRSARFSGGNVTARYRTISMVTV